MFAYLLCVLSFSRRAWSTSDLSSADVLRYRKDTAERNAATKRFRGRAAVRTVGSADRVIFVSGPVDAARDLQSQAPVTTGTSNSVAAAAASVAVAEAMPARMHVRLFRLFSGTFL